MFLFGAKLQTFSEMNNSFGEKNIFSFSATLGQRHAGWRWFEAYKNDIQPKKGVGKDG